MLAGPFAAAFLLSDAWANVVSTTDDARLAALGMAVVELTLATAALAAAVR